MPLNQTVSKHIGEGGEGACIDALSLDTLFTPWQAWSLLVELLSQLGGKATPQQSYAID